MTSRKNSNVTESVVTLKIRIKELEEQVSDYKKRLDGLRKAKNTTITRREREVLEVRDPNLGKRVEQDTRVAQLEKQLEDMKLTHSQELNNIRKSAAQTTACNHEEELLRLREQLQSVQAENAALVIENSDMKEQAERLMMELSVKEAKWCEMEEEYKIKMKTGWSEQYQQWMAATEQKIEELQRANALLRRMVRPPEGPDPTGQDS